MCCGSSAAWLPNPRPQWPLGLLHTAAGEWVSGRWAVKSPQYLQCLPVAGITAVLHFLSTDSIRLDFRWNLNPTVNYKCHGSSLLAPGNHLKTVLSTNPWKKCLPGNQSLVPKKFAENCSSHFPKQTYGCGSFSLPSIVAWVPSVSLLGKDSLIFYHIHRQD